MPSFTHTEYLTVPYCQHQDDSCIIPRTTFKLEIERQDMTLHGYLLGDSNLPDLGKQDVQTLAEYFWRLNLDSAPNHPLTSRTIKIYAKHTCFLNKSS